MAVSLEKASDIRSGMVIAYQAEIRSLWNDEYYLVTVDVSGKTLVENVSNEKASSDRNAVTAYTRSYPSVEKAIADSTDPTDFEITQVFVSVVDSLV